MLSTAQASAHHDHRSSQFVLVETPPWLIIAPAVVSSNRHTGSTTPPAKSPSVLYLSVWGSGHDAIFYSLFIKW